MAANPGGLLAEAIPTEGKILAVADSFDVLISERRYRSEVSVGAVLDELERCAGTQFDARLVEHMARGSGGSC